MRVYSFPKTAAIAASKERVSLPVVVTNRILCSLVRRLWCLTTVIEPDEFSSRWLPTPPPSTPYYVTIGHKLFDHTRITEFHLLNTLNGIIQVA